MAYSMYAYLRPGILDAGIPYWDEYFEANHWLKVPMPGDVYLFTHVKPRFENGFDRFIAFMNAVKAADQLGYVVELHADDYTNTKPSTVKEYMHQHGFSEYADRFIFS